jgi:hypothetical protein
MGLSRWLGTPGPWLTKQWCADKSQVPKVPDATALRFSILAKPYWLQPCSLRAESTAFFLFGEDCRPPASSRRTRSYSRLDGEAVSSSWGCGVRQSCGGLWACSAVAVLPWASSSASLSLSFLVCKLGKLGAYPRWAQ